MNRLRFGGVLCTLAALAATTVMVTRGHPADATTADAVGVFEYDLGDDVFTDRPAGSILRRWCGDAEQVAEFPEGQAAGVHPLKEQFVVHPWRSRNPVRLLLPGVAARTP